MFFSFPSSLLCLAHFRTLSRDLITACQFGGVPESGVDGVVEA